MIEVHEAVGLNQELKSNKDLRKAKGATTQTRSPYWVDELP